MVYYDYEYTRPREAKGGIRAQSKRGEFGASWWARRWVQALEKFSIGSRLSLGRSYARRGQVVSIDVGAGQGGGQRPGFPQSDPTGSASRWPRCRTPICTDFRPPWPSGPSLPPACWLVGCRRTSRMRSPTSDCPCFRREKSDLETDCSCPDFANPCKHIAAVYLLLGEEFDRDPFLIFRMRGIERDELLGPDLLNSIEASAWMSPTLPPEPLPADLDAFWGQPEWNDNYDDLIGPARVPEETAALPRQLGRFPFWQGSEEFLPTLEAVYVRASQAGLELYLGAERSARPSPVDGLDDC